DSRAGRRVSADAGAGDGEHRAMSSETQRRNKDPESRQIMSDAPQSSNEQQSSNDGALRKTRKRWLAIVLGTFTLIALGYGGYWAIALRNTQSTDDAYVSGNVVQITPQIAGTVVGIAADDTQFVTAGQTLVQLDPADARIALEQADAKLAKTVRDVRGLFATTAQLDATVGVRNADVARATQDLERRERLASAGAVSGEELQHARDA